jgi:hypothetical protein
MDPDNAEIDTKVGAGNGTGEAPVSFSIGMALAFLS